MSDVVIRVENLCKEYRLGTISHGTLYRDIQSGWAKLRGTEDPNAKIGSINTRQLNKTNDRFYALNDISFDVEQGEIVGIIGRNGAGKSTLLKIISRVTAPTQGSIKIKGRVASLLEVGTGFHPELSGRENIFLNGAILGMRKGEIEQKFDEIVKFAEIDKFIDTPVKRYSSGMYVRLAFAVAAHLDSDILIVDEVLAVGDVEFQKKSFGKMKSVGETGKTVLLVSHNMAMINNICRRAILLEDGHNIFDNEAGKVTQTYLSNLRKDKGEIIWPDITSAPGNEIVRLHAVRILQEGIAGASSDVDIFKEVIIQISYWNLKEGAVIYPAIWLRDKNGLDVLSSSHHKSVSLTEDFWAARPHPTGLFVSNCKIPGNFFNEGMYSVTAILGLYPSNTQVLEDYVVSFEVHDTGDMREEFYGGWLGVVRPKLAWSTELRST